MATVDTTSELPVRLWADAMSLIGDRTASFIIRVWRELSEENVPIPEWRGSIECVRTGEIAYFRNLTVMEEFLKRQLQQIGIEIGGLVAEPTSDADRSVHRVSRRSRTRNPRRGRQ